MIIGLTGTPSAGKGVVSEFFKKKGFIQLVYSDELRQRLRDKGIEVTRENMQAEGNALRKEKGAGAISELLVSKIKSQQYKNVIVDGIRNPAEIEVFRQLKNFYLIVVDAPQKLRFERMRSRNRENDPQTWEEFVKLEDREMGLGQPEDGLQIKRCIGQADYILINDGSLQDAEKKIEEIYEKIECHMPRPTWDEYFMEIARVVASRATCNRGRSGCVIARDKQILVTGYVGSPRGLPHCDEIGHQMKTVVHGDGTASQHCMRTAHAEANAIAQAARLGISVLNATMYCKMTPCAACAKLIINSGIKRVVAEKRYHQGFECEDMFRIAGVDFTVLDDTLEKYKGQ